eukprot:7252012-Prorocentrum_lima.AAC.1
MVLTVDGGIPYLSIPRDGLVAPKTTRACPAGKNTLSEITGPIERWAHVHMGAKSFISDPTVAGGPKLES